MSQAVVIVDYGVGNLRSVARAVAQCGFEPNVTSDVDAIREATHVIVPGVGAFGSCAEALKAHGLQEPVERFIESGRPLLGICVGMQMLLEASEEFGDHAGLGQIAGRVKPIPGTGSDGQRHKIPHVGWASLEPSGEGWEGTIFDGVTPGSTCYFVHSFAAQPQDPNVKLATCDYNGIEICAAVRTGNVYGVQFHPEKSGPVGLEIFGNFLRLPSS